MTLSQLCLECAIAEGILSAESRLTSHDLRANSAMRHKSVLGALPDLHKNPETTARVYDRNKEVGRKSF